MSGLVAMIVDGEAEGFVIDVRSYPGRGPAEPDTEKTVRGSRDGYTENIVVNTALTRRRIRTGKLRNVILKVGDQSKTDVVLMYIEGLADQQMVDDVKHRIEQVKVDGLTMTTGCCCGPSLSGDDSNYCRYITKCDDRSCYVI